MSIFESGQVLILFRFILLATVFCVILSPSPSYAADSVAFVHKNMLPNEPLKTLLSEHDFNQIAEVDLNNDSIDEYILEENTRTSIRNFEILALIDEKLIPLGNIRAQKIMLAYDEQNGVRSILGFKDAKNDYEYDVYAWDAMRSRYSNVKNIKTEGGSE